MAHSAARSRKYVPYQSVAKKAKKAKIGKEKEKEKEKETLSASGPSSSFILYRPSLDDHTIHYHPYHP